MESGEREGHCSRIKATFYFLISALYTSGSSPVNIPQKKKGLKLHSCNLANLGFCKNGKTIIPLAKSD